MAFQLSDTTWWLLLGIFAGFVAFWLIDKIFRRDGDYAAQKERREVESLNAQLTEVQTENADGQKKLTERNADVKRLTTLSEDLRDSVRGRDQKVTNLETALAAAREQQNESEKIRQTADQREKEVERLGEESRKIQLVADQRQKDVERLGEESQKIQTVADQRQKDVERLGEETQKIRAGLIEKDDKIRSLEVQLKSTQEDLKAQQAGVNKNQPDSSAASRNDETVRELTQLRQAAENRERELAQLRSELSQRVSSPSTAASPARPGPAAAAAAAAAAVTGAAAAKMSSDKTASSTTALKPADNKPTEKTAPGSSTPAPTPPSTKPASTPAKPVNTDAAKAGTTKANDASDKSDAAATGGVAQRHGVSATTDGKAKPENDSGNTRPGLIDRLRGAFSGRRPDDLD